MGDIIESEDDLPQKDRVDDTPGAPPGVPGEEKDISATERGKLEPGEDE